jgi:hypothetical protein
MEERRKHTRHRSLLGGRVAYNNNQCTIDGTLRNVSPEGALIVFGNPTTTPPEVILSVPNRQELRRARVVWSTNDRAGLELEPADPARLSMMQDQRLKVLERKNREIRKRIESASY